MEQQFLEFIKSSVENKESKNSYSSNNIDINKLNFFPEQKIKHFDTYDDGILFYKNQYDFKGLPYDFLKSLVEHNLKNEN